MENKGQNEQASTDNLPWDCISWWLVFVVAVIAIPALGFVIVTVTGVHGLMGIVVFTIACWACTYFGMYLVKHPSMREKIDFTASDK